MAVSLVGLVLVAALRLQLLTDRPLWIDWSIPLVLFAWFRRNWLLWSATAIYYVLFYVEIFVTGHDGWSGGLSMDGRIVNFVLGTVNLIVLASIIHFLCVVINDAERRTVAVDQLNAELRAVWRTAPVGLILVNEDLTDLRINPFGASLLGSPAEENVAADVKGQSSRYMTWRDGLTVAFEQSPLVRAARENVFVESQEFELAGPSGRRVTVLLAAAPIRRGGLGRGEQDGAAMQTPGRGKAAGAVAAFIDITAVKQLQRELDLRRREAEEASVRKTRFLSAVSHDIRTPANAISLLAELLGHASMTPAMTPEIPGFARDLRASAQKLVELVSDVLDFTKLDAGRADVVESVFDLGDLIHDECTQASVLGAAKGVTVDCRLPEGALELHTDRVKLGRILGNLLSNAVKFTKVGSVTVSVERTPVGDLFVRVADTGPGIPPEALSRIFDEFYQVRSNSSSTDPARQGSGLGLAICRRLSIALGMRLDVESEVGKGTTFTLHLPASLITQRVLENALDGVRDGARDVRREGARDGIRDNGRESVRETGRETGRDVGIERKGEGGVESQGPQGSRVAAREAATDGVKQVGH